MDRTITPQEGESLDMIESKARAQGVFVSRCDRAIKVNGPLQLDQARTCSECKCVTSEGNCYGFRLCSCGSFRRNGE